MGRTTRAEVEVEEVGLRVQGLMMVRGAWWQSVGGGLARGVRGCAGAGRGEAEGVAVAVAALPLALALALALAVGPEAHLRA